MFGQSHGKERPTSDMMMSFSQNIDQQVTENEGTAAEALSILDPWFEWHINTHE